MNFDNDLISIVVPIYKVEEYLDDCVKSIINQTYTNIEIILVDDGSPDGCPEICDAYSLQDYRVKVIHQKNGGLSKARNTGLKASKGKYIAFIDSDDFISLDMIEKMHTAIKNNDCQVACCMYYRFNGNSELFNKDDTTSVHETIVKDNIKALECIYNSEIKNIEFTAWNKLYLTSLFIENDVEYPAGKLHEDIFTTYKLLYHAEKVVFINQYLYFYRQRLGSIMNQPLTMKRLDALDAHEECLKFFWDKGEYRLLGMELNACLGQCKWLLEISKSFNSETDKQKFDNLILYKAKMSWNAYYKISKISIIKKIYYSIKYYTIVHKREIL